MFTINFFPYFGSFHYVIFSTKHKHAYTCAYICYSNDFYLRKILVLQSLREQKNCITWGVPVMDNVVSATQTHVGVQTLITSFRIFMKQFVVN
jgi:hypothetical protein